jgi:ParB family transcriptional regulator, chromosome partitioning protein
MSADTPRRLGRGLEALISTARQQREPSSAPVAETSTEGANLKRIRLADVTANRFQPRRTFTEPELVELEASIRASGLLQPIVVREIGNGKWELVAGERRLRAVTRLGWTEVPAVVRDFDDRAMLTLALVENLQRADLNPLEEAEGYQRLIDEFGLTQLQVAEAVGKDRTSVTNLLRVLSLPPAVRQLVEGRQISAGHARALLPIKDERQQVELANEIVAHQLSVREVEARAREITNPTPATPKPTDRVKNPAPESGQDRASTPALRRIEDQFRKRLQTDVQVQMLGNERGVVRITFYSADDLDRLLDAIVGPARSDFD